MRNSPGHTDILARQHRVAILTPAERERALTRAAEVGAAQAGRELGIAPGTIRVWRSRAAVRAENGGRVDMPGDVSGVDPADTWTAAQEALAQFRELMASGKTLEAQRAAISMGVLIDKSRILEERAAMAHERAVVLAADQAKMVVRMIPHSFAGVGVTDGRGCDGGPEESAAAGGRGRRAADGAVRVGGGGTRRAGGRDHARRA